MSFIQLKQLEEHNLKLEEANSRLRQVGIQNNARSKTRFERDAETIKQLTEANTELQRQMEALNKELQELKARSQEAAASGAPVDPGLVLELEALRAEKASLEQAFAKEQAAHLVSSAQVSEQAATLVRLGVRQTRGPPVLIVTSRTSFVQSAIRFSRRRRNGRPRERRPWRVPQTKASGKPNARSC